MTCCGMSLKLVLVQLTHVQNLCSHRVWYNLLASGVHAVYHALVVLDLLNTSVNDCQQDALDCPLALIDSLIGGCPSRSAPLHARGGILFSTRVRTAFVSTF